MHITTKQGNLQGKGNAEGQSGVNKTPGLLKMILTVDNKNEIALPFFNLASKSEMSALITHFKKRKENVVRVEQLSHMHRDWHDFYFASIW